MIILQMAGFPGSGKSTVSKHIAKKIGAVVIDKDIMKSTMLNYGLDNQTASKLAYEIMFDLGKFHLAQGQSVIFDTPCYYDEIVEQGQTLSKQFKAKYKYLDCFVDDYNIIHERISKRDNMVSQITLPSKESFDRAKQRVLKPEGSYLRVDTSDFDSIDFEGIMEHLKR